MALCADAGCIIHLFSLDMVYFDIYSHFGEITQLCSSVILLGRVTQEEMSSHPVTQ